MTERKSKPVGTTIEVPEGATVRRPDDSEVTVTGGAYVLDVPGVHVIDGRNQPVHLDSLGADGDSGHVDDDPPEA